MTRRKTSLFEDLIGIAGKLPWWLSLLLAAVSYLVLHTVASRPVILASNAPGQFGGSMAAAVITGMTAVLQYILPAVFGLGTLLSALSAARDKKLYNATTTKPGVSALFSMRWEDFERLVGEYYRRKGFQVAREGGNDPDGGIDLILRKGSETYLVQCKQWRAYKVGVQPVREFYGVMSARGVAGGYFVTAGEFTEEARAFAKGLNLELIDGCRLRAMIETAGTTFVAEVDGMAASLPSTPLCPKCGATMQTRTARQGRNAGKEFWGCSAYPQCNGTLPLH